MVGFALELDRADKAAAGAGGEPSLNERQEPRRIAHDIREQPIDRSDRVRIECEGALAPVGLKLSMAVRERIQQVGFVLVILLMVFVLTNDALKQISIWRTPAPSQPAATPAK